MKKLVELIRRFILRRSRRRRAKPGGPEISPEAQVEIERRRGPQWPL